MATGFNTQCGNGEYRLQLETDNREYYLLMQETARRCVDGKPMTNADRIRAMTDEELRNFLFDIIPYDYACEFCVPKMRTDSKCDGHCKNGILNWLQQPMKEGADHA